MGKTRKRMTMAKYANKYAAKRAARTTRDVPPATVDADTTVEEPITPEPVVEQKDTGMEVLTTKDLMEESNSDIIVVKNKKAETKPTIENTTPMPEPQLQQVEIEKPKRKPSGLKQTRTRRKTTKTKKD
jgi:hypothetical protein